MAKREIIKSLKRYISLLNAEGINVNKAFLFGSHSKNTASEDSDIDVMLVLKDYDGSDDITIGKTWSLTLKVNPKIEPFMVGLKKFQDESSPFVNMIKSKGIEIL